MHFFVDHFTLNPTFGNREGGTGVVVTGPIFISTDNVTCIFGGQEVEGVVLSEENVVLCTTPRLHRTGRMPVMIRHNQILLQEQAYFYSGICYLLFYDMCHSDYNKYTFGCWFFP